MPTEDGNQPKPTDLPPETRSPTLAVWPPPPNVRPPVAFPRRTKQFWPLGGLLIALGCILIDAQIPPGVFWGRLTWPEAAIPCIALLLGLPWSVVDAVRGGMRGHRAGFYIGVIGGLLNLLIGLSVIYARPK